NLWVATGAVTFDQTYKSEGGLTKISPQGGITTLHTGNSQLPNNVVNKLSVDPSGNLWASLGTWYDQSFFIVKLLNNKDVITMPTIISGAVNGLPKSDVTDMLF